MKKWMNMETLVFGCLFTTALGIVTLLCMTSYVFVSLAQQL